MGLSKDGNFGEEEGEVGKKKKEMKVSLLYIDTVSSRSWIKKQP